MTRITWEQRSNCANLAQPLDPPVANQAGEVYARTRGGGYSIWGPAAAAGHQRRNLRTLPGTVTYAKYVGTQPLWEEATRILARFTVGTVHYSCNLLFIVGKYIVVHND